MKKRKRVQVLNTSSFARLYTGYAGETLMLEPGHTLCDESVVKSMRESNKRFDQQIREGTLVIERETAIADLAQKVMSGEVSVASIEYPRDAVAVAKVIDDIPVLERMYRESNRVSVRDEIVRKLRKLGYTGE